MIKVCKNCGEEYETNRSKRDYCSTSCSNSVIAKQREANKLDVPIKTVWSCGGGVQSTAIAALIYTGRLPKPDYAIMTDCGFEKATTWEHVHNFLIPKMKEVGVDLQIIKTNEGLKESIFDKSNHLLLPGFAMKEGKKIKFNTHCNSGWKVKPAQRWLREQGVQHCENWVGISLDEASRARGGGNKNWFKIRYPLIEQKMTREDCLWFMGGIGWPKPPRTSCYMCPQQNDAAWLKMRDEEPDDWAKAIEIDEYIRTITPGTYLHRTFTPLKDMG